ncbi:MFS transporter [Lysobacter ciconiae]|uniref:MFS transporter n=2 Tax=Novilysobacter ciconiae TaxID=2781022 RepID=A0A7S6ZSE0_9GAMM|nr:MFS transporter [Lysobacter ciconiae]
MKPGAMSFHHPLAFWAGGTLLVAGVLSHLPMFLMGRHTGWQMVGMPMDGWMLTGMALIPLGLGLAFHGLMPRLGRMRHLLPAGEAVQFHLADSVGLNREHWKVVAVLVVALTVDVMKPATTGFVIPGLTAEYNISTRSAGWLALVALMGTTVGSLVWGRLADAYGRRAAILLSALMFMGTAICGAMPAFGWNLAMCFLMGASAGGLLPITFTLMAEIIPTAHRGWLLVALGGIGTSAGYLAAAAAATWLEPMFSWRALWLLGLPTGALIILLNRFIPESPRFLSAAGLPQQARAVLAQFSGAVPVAKGDAAEVTIAAVEATCHPAEAGTLLRGAHARIGAGLAMCGIGWGLVTFGFVLWLPVNLVRLGVDADAASALLAQSALLALPGIGLVVWLYHRWSTIRSLVAFIALTALALAAFAVIDLGGLRSVTATTLATAALLVSSGGVIAMLIPYAAEIYPAAVRGTGAGMIAASSKFGGILGAGLGVLGLFEHVALSALAIALAMAVSGLVLARHGVETRGRRLEEIQRALAVAAA